MGAKKNKLEKTVGFEFEDTPTTLHSELKLGSSSEEPEVLDLFSGVGGDFDKNIIYIDTNNSKGKTVSVFLIKNGMLANHLEIGKSANTNILNTLIEDTYYNSNDFTDKTPNKEERDLVRKWLSKEPDLGNKFEVKGDGIKLLNDIKNFVRACY